MENKRYLIFGIILLAAFLRLWNISVGDPLTDEILYSFRAVGMLDFDEAAEQTTPLEWFDPHIPAWTRFSFHDHPPLVFLIQHISMEIFGETRFAFRFPSAIFGIASVYLLYLIGKKLYSENTGLAAAILLAVTVNHAAISRLGLQESQVIFFMLLAVYWFLRALEHSRYFIWTGVALGFAFLSKYTSFVLIPVFVSYLLIVRRGSFKNRNVWIGAILALVIFSPVLIYNYRLYRAVGHFDFQFSYLLGQHPEEWPVSPGKEEFPTMTSRAASFFPNLLAFNSWLLLCLFGAAIAAFIFALFKQLQETFKQHSLSLLTFFWLTLLILVIGPSLRFLSMFTPFIVLGAAIFIVNTNSLGNRASKLFAGTVLFFEILYTANSQLLPYPKGLELWTYSAVRNENYNWGYNELETFLTEELENKMPGFAFEAKYQFIETIHEQALQKAKQQKLIPYAALIIYDKNIDSIPQLWILDRLQIYHAWPVIPVETYAQFLREKGPAYFKQAGLEKTYFITPTEHVPWKKPHLVTDVGQSFEQELIRQGIQPSQRLKNKRGEEAFRIYEF